MRTIKCSTIVVGLFFAATNCHLGHASSPAVTSVDMPDDPAVAQHRKKPAVNSKRPAQYPNKLHGFWIHAESTCPKKGGFYDGETIMDISPGKLYGYEEVSKPTKVTLISGEPVAWRIESIVDIGPSDFYSEDEPRIFILGEGRLTVVTSGTVESYRKCPSN